MIASLKLKDKLAEDENWYSKSYEIIKGIKTYINNTDLYFFPEYTSHRLAHIENILYLIERLIPNYTLEKKLTPKDISFLIMSVYLHDLAMFLKPAGLNALLRIEEWKQKFNDFIKIMSRLSDAELKKIYGIGIFRYPQSLDNRLELSEFDRLTYGEFIRRNHAAIAEYIAVNGFPGDNYIYFFDRLTLEERKIVGIIAKSHCMSIRTAAAESNLKLIGKVDAYKPSNVPIVYLMVLLRMGDILDMGKDRAPHINFDVQHFLSPLSQEEWEWNQTIDSHNFGWDTVRTLYIQAEPKTTFQFVKIENNLKWFQTELDYSWAALCDYYAGTYELTINRIESNIFEQPELFKEDFLTKEARIKIVSNLSGLLIEPLYHANPLFGVRELIQNAMDACNLRYKIEKSRGNTAFEGCIYVNVDLNNSLFTIKDNGIGMDEDVIVNYYLSIGASFRNSDYWKQACSVSDENITRTGRFGIGFLATFLLGKKITVYTRHIDDSKGYVFNVTLEDDIINAERRENIDFGTTICVELSNDALDYWNNYLYGNTMYSPAILWNEWYHFTEPKIIYNINERVSKPRFIYPVPHNQPNDIQKWFQVDSKNFVDVKYGFFPIPRCFRNVEKRKSQLGECSLLSNVVLNGIIVNEKVSFINVWGLPEETVICSIIDDKNLLNIDLSRKSINYDHEVFDEINTEIWKWQIASLLCCNIPAIRRKGKKKRQKLHGYIIKSDYPDGLLIKEDGFSFWHPYFLKKLFCDKIYMIKEPLTEDSPNVSIQTHITDSDFPFLIYKDQSFKQHFKDMSVCSDTKSDHIFALVKPDITSFKFNSRFVELIDDLFSDVEDLWIPYDFNLRQQKFKKAFSMLSNYSMSGRLELSKKVNERSYHTFLYY